MGLERRPFRDAEARMMGDTERKSSDSSNLPVKPYDVNDAQAWVHGLRNGGFADKTIRTLGSVNGGHIPIRWLVSIIDTAQTVEALLKHNVNPPQEWKQMFPVHINATCNDTNPQEGLRNAEILHRLSLAYLDHFHPRVPKPKLEIDKPEAVASFMKKGERFFPNLPDYIREELQKMAEKHSGEGSQKTAVAAYLLAHYNAYGLIDGDLFPLVRNTIFILPQSEDRFLTMIEESKESIRELGLDIKDIEEQGSVVLISNRLRSPHYYPHKGEPTLENVYHPQQWPTPNQLHHTKGLNELARNEIIEGLRSIEEDIGGKKHLPELTNILKKTFH